VGNQGFPHVENPLPYRLATPQSQGQLCPVGATSVSAGAIEQEDRKEEEREQHEHDYRKQLHHLPEQRDDH
jgi:hypothetical protein